MSVTEQRPMIASPAEPPVAGPPSRPRRGRPLLMSRERVLERIHALARGEDGLFRVHRAHPGLYARARRLFGSWAGAVAAAGLDYRSAIGVARERSLRTRLVRARARRRAARR